MVEKDDILIDDTLIENEDEELNHLQYSESAGSKTPIFSNVRVTKKDFSIFELFRKHTNRTLILTVGFQRNTVWNNKQRCELIESILMGLPLPIFYFKQTDNAYTVIDGKQRLSTLFSYLNDEFALRKLEILPNLNNKKFNDLTDDLGIYRSQLEDYQVYSHVILPPTPDKIIFDIFDRVNRGGTKLNKQEIRNALYQGPGLDMIGEITKTKEFKTATRLNNQNDSRMRGAYLTTRFLAFYLLRNGLLTRNGEKFIYAGDIDELIELTLRHLNRVSENDLNQILNMAKECLRKAHTILGRGAFRREFNETIQINMNIFETTLYFMSMLPESDSNVIKEEIKDKLHGIIIGDEFLSCIGNGRDYTANANMRFKLMENLAKEFCND